MKKNTRFYFEMSLLLVLTLGFVYWIIRSPYFWSLNNWVSQNTLLYVVILFVYKTIGVLWPPIPAGILTMASIPFLGWGAYAVDLAGSIAGGSVAYFLGRRYGLTLLKKIFDRKIIEKISHTKIKKGREIEAVFVYRILLGTVILEAIYYGAGFLKVNFGRFLIGAILSHLVVGIPLFLLAESIFSGKNTLITIFLAAFGIFLVFKTKGRYFE